MLAVLLAAAALAATTNPATNITASTATLNGTLGDATTAHFQWGTTSGYGERTASKAVTDGKLQDSLAGLTPDTTYHYRVVPDDGTDTAGQDVTFRTAGPPAVSNQLASNVTASSATLSTTIDTKGLKTSYRIQWGASTGFGRFTEIQSADSGTAAGTFTLTGLQPNRTYYWRTRASNAAGTTLGARRSFKTAPMPTGVSLTLSRRTVPWGDGVRLGGRVTGSGVKGLTLTLEQQRLGIDQGFTAIDTARTGNDGGYLFTIPRLWTTTRYRVRTQTQNVITSADVTARSQVRAGIRARHFRRRARIEGSVRPGVQGEVVLLLHRRGRGWQRVRTATLTPATESASRYRFSVRRLKRTARRFRVIARPTGEAYVRDWSRAVKVRRR